MAWSLTPCCARAFELGVPLCVLIFAVAAQLDPGRVPPRVKGSSAVEERGPLKGWSQGRHVFMRCFYIGLYRIYI